MTATQHAARASVAIPYAVPVGNPVYSFDFGTWAGNLPTNWFASGGVTAARAYNLLAGAIEANVTYPSGGGSLFTNLPVGSLVAGRTYRVYATVRNMGTASVIPVAYCGAQPSNVTGPLQPGAVRVVWSDFTATSNFDTVFVTTAANPTSQAGTLALSLVQVIQVAPQVVYDLTPQAASVTLDESWTPYCRATLVCPMPPPDALAKIDPRTPLRVALALTRTGALSLLVSDLTAMLALSNASTFNLASSPRSNTWTTPGAWANSPLTGVGINPPNGVEGGSRFISTAVATGDVFTLASSTVLNAGTQYVASVYLRSSANLAVRFKHTRGASIGQVDVTLPAGRWTRVQVPVTPAAGGTSTFTVQTMGSVAVCQVLDLTQAMIEAGAAASTYLDGSIGRVGNPDGFPLWQGAAFASSSIKRFGASRVSDFTSMLTGTTAAYFSDLFGDQLNAVLDTSLNQTRTFDLMLRSRSLNYISDTMTLELTSDEMMLRDLGRINTTDPTLVPLATTELKLLVSWALNLIGTDLERSSGNFVIAAPAATDWSLGTSVWDFLDGYMADAGLRLWCDEHRAWWLRSFGAQGADGITSVTVLDDDLDREGWADALVLANNWTDPATGVKTTTYAGASLSGSASYTKSTVIDKSSQRPATAAAAATLLNRVKTRGRTVRVQAVSDYNVTPGHTCTISTPSTVIDPLTTSSVTWRLPGDEMEIATRDTP